MGGGPATDLLLCLLTFPEPKSILARLRETFPKLDIVYIQVSPPTSSAPSSASTSPVSPSLWSKATILFTLFSFPPTPSSAPKLRLVHLSSAGSNHVQHEPLYLDTTIPITTSSGIHGPQIAEWVLLTRLVSSHSYHVLHGLQLRHEWGGGEEQLRNTRDLVGGRVGILGYGSIGRQIGRVARAMGMRVVAYTATEKRTPEQRKDRGFIVPGTGDPEGEVPAEWCHGLEKEKLREFLGKELDWLVISVPLTKQTEGLLGREEWRVLSEGGKRKVFVSNIARGQIIKQDEFVEAVKEGLVDGGAVDVTDPEPLPKESPLWDLENVIVTPHIAGLGQAYVGRTFQVLEENLRRREKGERLVNVVRRERGYVAA